MIPDNHFDMITDYVTGKQVPDSGAEANRQEVERVLVDQKGYARSDIVVDMPVSFIAAAEKYRSAVDLVVFAEKQPFMVIKSAAGSLDSRKKEAIAAARVLFDRVVPYAAASDGNTALVFDAATGKQIGQGLEALPDAQKAKGLISKAEPFFLPEKRMEKERIIFRSYDIMNVNTCRKAKAGT
ncbi:MAG: type I restriction enzyme HsdR N-terminal domain-containing protein [Desulfobacteraceae bacterium]|nr:type I restriction enzyme HsdR N-terminal domain-containing protein [Desulfobacteraceae bacterium]